MTNMQSTPVILFMWTSIIITVVTASVGIGLLVIDVVTYVVGECS